MGHVQVQFSLDSPVSTIDLVSGFSSTLSVISSLQFSVTD